MTQTTLSDATTQDPDTVRFLGGHYDGYVYRAASAFVYPPVIVWLVSDRPFRPFEPTPLPSRRQVTGVVLYKLDQQTYVFVATISLAELVQTIGSL